MRHATHQVRYSVYGVDGPLWWLHGYVTVGGSRTRSTTPFGAGDRGRPEPRCTSRAPAQRYRETERGDALYALERFAEIPHDKIWAGGPQTNLTFKELEKRNLGYGIILIGQRDGTLR